MPMTGTFVRMRHLACTCAGAVHVDLQLSAAVDRAPVAIAHAEPCKIYEVTGMLLG